MPSHPSKKPTSVRAAVGRSTLGPPQVTKPTSVRAAAVRSSLGPPPPARPTSVRARAGQGAAQHSSSPVRLVQQAGQRAVRAGVLVTKTYAEYQVGVLEGLGQSLKSTWGFVTHDAWQVKTWTEMGTTMVAISLMSPQSGGPMAGYASAAWLDQKLGTQFAPRQVQIVMALDQTFKEMPHWQAKQWGQLVGRVAGDVLTTKGAGAGLKVAGRVGATAARVAKTNVAAMNLGTMSAGQAAKTIAQKLPTIFTDADGYLIGPIRLNAPFPLRVQRFGLMSLNRLDYWGPRTFGSSQFAARRFNAIIPSWNDLTLYTKGVIPKGVNLRVGITGSQGWRYPGGLYQVQVESHSVLQQSSKILPKGK